MPPTATRSRGSSRSPATPSTASTTSTTRAARSAGSPSRSRRGRAATSRPRTATRASTSPSSPPRSRAPPTWTSTRSPATASSAPPAPRGAARLAARIRATLDVYRVHFDTWFTERTLHEGEPSAIDRALARLREQGHLYEGEGALWLRTTTFGGDKDRVLIRSGGEPTYFAADVAYHEDKLERGYDRMIN